MIELDFSISSLKPYEKYLIRYQGLDLSFLGINSQKYLNKWAMPNITRTVEDRELVLTYAVPDRKTAKEIANSAMHSDSNLVTSTAHPPVDSDPGWTAFCNCENVSWDEFSNRIEVTVRYIIESGFIHEETFNGKQVFLMAHDLGNSTALDWEVNIEPTELNEKPLTIGWETFGRTGKVTAKFEMSLPESARIHFSTLDLENSRIASMSIAEAVKGKILIINGPLLPSPMDNNATAVKFNVGPFDQTVDVNWKIWKRFLLL